MIWRALVFLVVLVGSTLSVSRAAFADEAAARAHFRKGIELYDRKQYTEALSAFQDAYREKPSGGIKQNIALCLKSLDRPVDAATSFDEALDEGKGTLKPETKAAIERELSELTKVVATLNIKVTPDDKKVVDAVVVEITAAGSAPRALAPGAQRRPIRLAPGLYTFSAHAPGYGDPGEKKLGLVAGAPVDTTFAFVAAGAAAGGTGTLTIRPSVDDAAISVDGNAMGHGTWTGKLPAGTHKVEASAPGFKTTTVDVSVSSGATVDYPIRLLAAGEAPPEYVAPANKVAPKKKLYAVLGGSLDTVSYRLGVPLGEPAPYGTRRSNFAGLGIDARIGYLLGKFFAVELQANLGGMSAKYKLVPSDSADSETKIVHWQLTPALRFSTPGSVRFTAATGFGVHGLGVETKLARPNAPTKKGAAVGASWTAEAGIQADTGPVFLEAALFLNVHGVGAVRDESPPEDRLLYASPATRGGARIGVGIPF